ncbi:ParA family protein [Microbulbifer sp. MCCC 1A16149]|uniref:ParA family protein n=1 Tax=Microbulbifer sp. MCCC 1A16149 TaxID=3411322 RepID=UPI003D124370
MSKIFAVANQKGGVGKTTTCVNLSASLVASKRRVLLIDLDPQGNATMGSGVDKSELQLSSYDVLASLLPPRKAIVTTSSGFDLMPANIDLSAAEVELLEMDGRESRLRLALAEISNDYDYIIIDCPPSLNMLTVNALCAAGGVLIPMQCEYYALEGLSSLIDTITQVQQAANPDLRIEGILRTMYDPRNSLTGDVSDQLNEYFGDRLYRTCIPRNVRLAEAPSFGKPALEYDRNSKGAIAYLALAGEITRRHAAANQSNSNSNSGPRPVAEAV